MGSGMHANAQGRAGEISEIREGMGKGSWEYIRQHMKLAIFFFT